MNQPTNHHATVKIQLAANPRPAIKTVSTAANIMRQGTFGDFKWNHTETQEEKEKRWRREKEEQDQEIALEREHEAERKKEKQEKKRAQARERQRKHREMKRAQNPKPAKTQGVNEVSCTTTYNQTNDKPILAAGPP